MSKVSGWKLMGESSTRDLVAGVLRASGLHFLVAENDDERKSIVGDLAVSIVARAVACDVVQEAKKVLY